MNPQHAYIFLTKRPERVDFQTDDENVWMNIIMLLLNLSSRMLVTDKMKETKIIAKAENFTATDFGKMSDLKDYILEFTPEIKVSGKVFGGQSVNATGSEFSFQVMVPGQETGFLHTHKNHEELYFFLSGKGEFQVDGEVFPVQEESVVRVAPDGKRSVRNSGRNYSTTSMISGCSSFSFFLSFFTTSE